jgi:hypothetical protein
MPVFDKGFSRENFEGILTDLEFECIERKTMEFVYPLFLEERFFQSVAVVKKLFI